MFSFIRGNGGRVLLYFWRNTKKKAPSLPVRKGLCLFSHLCQVLCGQKSEVALSRTVTDACGQLFSSFISSFFHNMSFTPLISSPFLLELSFYFV